MKQNQDIPEKNELNVRTLKYMIKKVLKRNVILID